MGEIFFCLFTAVIIIGGIYGSAAMIFGGSIFLTLTLIARG